MKQKVVVSWSGGKDSALALYETLNNPKYSVVKLLTVLTKDYERISMHGIRKKLLDKQAKSLGLDIEKVYILKTTTNEEYEEMMKKTMSRFRESGVDTIVFGDIFLEDLRKQREDNLSKVDMKAYFPLWKKDTKALAHSFIDLGFRSVITCVDTHILDSSFSGRDIDREFLEDLPSDVDCCGERGEFHSFAYDGPIFRKIIPFKKGIGVMREKRFYFTDLI